METLADYIRWVGDLDFCAYPFRDADALVLSNIAYYDLDPVMRQEKPEHTVSDCIPMIEAGEAKLMITGGDLGNGEVLERAARSKRYGALRLSDYENTVRADPPLQFSAVTFRAPTFSYIAFRGTDASLAGWRENCMISFTETEAQKLSLAYAERLIDDGVWYLGGHSKGANLAQYAACLLSDPKWDKVQHVWLLDGPGFCPEVLNPRLDERIDPKTTRIIPEYDVVGKLFEPKITDTKIVRSSRYGIVQHSLATWQVEYGELATTDHNDPGSMWLNRLMNDWLESISQKDRPVFINELFDALAAEGSESLEDLDLDRLQTVLIKLTGVSKTTRKSLRKLPKQLFRDDDLPKIPRSKFEKLHRLFSDLRIQGAGLLLISLILTLMSGILFELTTIIIITAVAAFQMVLTIRKLIKQRGMSGEMRGRFFVLIAMLALAVILFFKEQAMFLIGSGLYGIVCLALSFWAIWTGSKQKDKRSFLHTLAFIEGAVIGLIGLGYLLIPQSIVQPFTIALAACIALDGIIRLVCWLVRYIVARKREKAVSDLSRKRV
jgi:hypothetical protein